jgi:enterochelin esterase family protein
MPEAAPTPLTRRRRSDPRGVVTPHDIPTQEWAIGDLRTVHFYQPPTEEPSPLIVVLDGQDYLRRARLPQMLDNLIARQRIRPVALALVENRSDARGVEYACNEGTIAFLVACVLPLARKQLNLLNVRKSPGAYGILGASMGGLMALYTALRAPQIFGHVLSQSGAFGFGRYDSVVFDLVRHSPPKPLKIWMDVGRFEDLVKPNRRMAKLLTRKGYEVTYREYNGGHNYPAWRDDVWRGLETLFGA